MSSKYDHLDREKLISLLVKRDQDDRRRRFGLRWERDEIEHDHAINSDFVCLDLDPEASEGPAPYAHQIIEGDNFDALRNLSISFSGRVKCIYIDPPYNTGKKDFTYNDRFIGEDDVWRFSTWTEFLYRRLLIARELLAEDGVILVSINDENRAKLELLMDEVFPGMRIGSFAWRTKDTGSGPHRFSHVHEHILIYGGKQFTFNGKKTDLSKYRNPDNDPRGPWAPRPITKRHSYKDREKAYYHLQDPVTGYWYPCDPDTVWRYASRTKMAPGQKLRTEPIEDLIARDEIFFPPCDESDLKIYNSLEEIMEAIKSGTGPVLPKKKTPLLREDLPDLEHWIGKPIAPGRPSRKDFLYNKSEEDMIAAVSSWIAGVNEEVQFDTAELDEDIEVLRSPKGGIGSDDLKKVMGYAAFSHPKPVELIKHLIRQSTDKSSIVLDFFAGSGTTGQAVLELNLEDGGTRRFILVSNTEATGDEPDKNICRDICAERVRRVISGMSAKDREDVGFAYFRTRRIPIAKVHRRIGHDQVWYALQQVYADRIAQFSSDAHAQVSETDQQILVYLPQLGEGPEGQLRKIIDNADLPVLVFSWQPGMLTTFALDERVTIERIPDFLLDRFKVVE